MKEKERFVCTVCQDEFPTKKALFHHRDQWGCPLMRSVLNEIVAPLCLCGCGERTNVSKRDSKIYSKYRVGHNTRMRKRENYGTTQVS